MKNNTNEIVLEKLFMLTSDFYFTKSQTSFFIGTLEKPTFLALRRVLSELETEVDSLKDKVEFLVIRLESLKFVSAESLELLLK